MYKRPSQYSLSPDPADWGAAIGLHETEPDDSLHNPHPKRDRKDDSLGTVFTTRGLANLGCTFILVAGIVALL